MGAPINNETVGLIVTAIFALVRELQNWRRRRRADRRIIQLRHDLPTDHPESLRPPPVYISDAPSTQDTPVERPWRKRS